MNNKFYAERLTYRETQCLLYLMRGESAKLISKHLCVSFRTVEKYIGSLKYKLHCKNREELIEKAYEYNLFYSFFNYTLCAEVPAVKLK